jgi:hypothetical protein
MKSRSAQTIESVIKSLENQQSPRKVSAMKVGNQNFNTVDNVVITMNKDGTPNLPLTTFQILTALASELKLDPADDINKKSAIKNGVTLLIEATLTNQDEVVTALLNHGADPTICDDDGNNAFIHAAKKANSSILKEFLTLIKTKDKAKKEIASEEKIEAAPSDLSHYEKNKPLASATSHTTTTQTGEMSERISLEPEVLAHANKAGETAINVIEQYKSTYALTSPKPVDKKSNSQPQRSKKKTAEQKANDADILARMTALVEELRAINPPPKSLPQNKPASGKPEQQKVDPVYQEKVRRAEHVYDAFFRKKEVNATRECRYIARLYSDTDQSRARELFRIANLHLDVTNQPAMPAELVPTTMPVSFKDQGSVHAALALLKDYYAPESAPFSKSTKWNSLRRLFTLHRGRRYCDEAEKFYKELIVMPLANPRNIVDIHDAIDRKLTELKQRPHGKKDNNDIFNSSFTRRLFYIREAIKKTESYEAIQNNLSNEIYLAIVDGTNNRSGILGISPLKI